MDHEDARTTWRTAEEIAWDQEFREERPSTSSLTADMSGLIRFAARIPGALVQGTMNMIPDETVRHTRAAARESFLAVRSLLGAVGDRIEDMLAEPGTVTTGRATVKGPPGTWGTGRAAERPTSSEKVKRIEIGDEVSSE